MTLKLLSFSIFVEEEILYKDPKEKYPIKRTDNDRMNSLFVFINQYKKKITFNIIRKETPKLRTESTENVLGGKKGKANENNNKTAIITLM
jgi:hypothetical protein